MREREQRVPQDKKQASKQKTLLSAAAEKFLQSLLLRQYPIAAGAPSLGSLGFTKVYIVLTVLPKAVIICRSVYLTQKRKSHETDAGEK